MAWDKQIKEDDIIIMAVESMGPGYTVVGRAFVCDGKGFGTDPRAVGTAIYGKWLDGAGEDRVERTNISKLETLAFREGMAYVSTLVLQKIVEKG